MSSQPSREAIPTQTMADLYVEQGHLHRALGVYRLLLARQPGDATLLERIGEIQALAAERSDEEVERLARDLAAGGGDEHDVETPFAWTDDEEEAYGEGPAIGDFFEGLLAWEAKREAREEGGEP